MDGTKLETKFANRVLWALSNDTDFYLQIGVHVEPAMFVEEHHQKIVDATRSLYQETGKPPSSDVAVTQRLQLWVNQGKIRADVLFDAIDTFAQADCTDIALEDLVTGLRPVVQHFHRHNAVHELIQAHGRRESLVKECTRIIEINQMGISTSTSGSGFDDAHRIMSEMRNLDRFPTGIDGIDEKLGGGFPRSSVTLWVGSTGEGKSYALCHQAAVGLVRGLNVAYVSIELPEAIVWSRIMAALTGYSVDDFTGGVSEAMQAVESVRSQIGGEFRVARFDANACTTQDIVAFLDRAEEITGRQVDMVLVDPVDRLTIPGLTGHSKASASSYALGETIMNSLRDDIAVPRSMWLHVTSQAKRRDGRAVAGKHKDTDSVADSLHKSRIADNIVTLTVSQADNGNRQMEVFVAKHRTGIAGFSVGPSPVAFAYGMLFPSTVLQSMHPQEDFSGLVFQEWT